MKTIEERAELYQQYQEICSGNFALAYLKGAKNQQKIDTDKAKAAFESTCKWLSVYFWYSAVFIGLFLHIDMNFIVE